MLAAIVIVVSAVEDQVFTAGDGHCAAFLNVKAHTGQSLVIIIDCQIARHFKAERSSQGNVVVSRVHGDVHGSARNGNCKGNGEGTRIYSRTAVQAEHELTRTRIKKLGNGTCRMIHHCTGTRNDGNCCGGSCIIPNCRMSGQGCPQLIGNRDLDAVDEHRVEREYFLGAPLVVDIVNVHNGSIVGEFRGFMDLRGGCGFHLARAGHGTVGIQGTTDRDGLSGSHYQMAGIAAGGAGALILLCADQQRTCYIQIAVQVHLAIIPASHAPTYDRCCAACIIHAEGNDEGLAGRNGPVAVDGAACQQYNNVRLTECVCQRGIVLCAACVSCHILAAQRGAAGIGVSRIGVAVRAHGNNGLGNKQSIDSHIFRQGTAVCGGVDTRCGTALGGDLPADVHIVCGSRVDGQRHSCLIRKAHVRHIAVGADGLSHIIYGDFTGT